MRAHKIKVDHCTFILNLFYEHVYHVFLLCFINKAVVGSGNEGTPTYAGEGVTYGVFLGSNHIFSHVHTI